MQTIEIKISGNIGTSYSRSVVPRAKKLFMLGYPELKAICHGVDESKTVTFEPIMVHNYKHDREFSVVFEIL